MKERKWLILISFGCGLAALSTFMIPALSVLLAISSIIASVFAWKGPQRNMVFSGVAMALLALIMDLIYLWVVLAGKA